jgi:hypothetical protein
MARTLSQDSGIVAFEDHHSQLQARNRKLANQISVPYRRCWRRRNHRPPVKPFSGAPLRVTPFTRQVRPDRDGRRFSSKGWTCTAFFIGDKAR